MSTRSVSLVVQTSELAITRNDPDTVHVEIIGNSECGFRPTHVWLTPDEADALANAINMFNVSGQPQRRTIQHALAGWLAPGKVT